MNELLVLYAFVTGLTMVLFGGLFNWEETQKKESRKRLVARLFFLSPFWPIAVIAIASCYGAKLLNSGLQTLGGIIIYALPTAKEIGKPVKWLTSKITERQNPLLPPH